MITPIETAWEPDLWRNELRNAIRSSAALLDYVGLQKPNGPSSAALQAAENDFPVLVPRGFAARMQPADANDPLLLQVIADAEENSTAPGFVKDPLQETTESAIAAPGLIKKYQGRALLITTTGCAVHCRYCFRRHFPYDEHRPNVHAAALAEIRADTSLTEVILSGGDPLLLDDKGLASLLGEIGSIPHVKRIRIHSRIPIVLPERVTAELVAAIHQCPVPVVMVVHANHARELDATTARALAVLAKTVRFLSNQAVLLRGINNTVEAQINLCEALFDQQVQPYYLHLPDRVSGTHHFYVDEASAQDIYRGMQAALPGYLVPKLVRELPGASAKTLMAT